MTQTISKLITYTAPQGVPANNDFIVKVRTANGEWQQLFTYLVRVDMHNVREASMASFDFNGSALVEVTSVRAAVDHFEIRPLSNKIEHTSKGNTVTFQLDRPCKLSIEVNGDKFHNLHLFANSLESNVPDPQESSTLYVEPGTYAAADLVRRLQLGDENELTADVLYFGPGLHRFEDGLLHIPSGTTVYIAGGAVVVGSFICNHVDNVTIRGRGIIYLKDIEKTTYWRSVQIEFSRKITVEGILSIDPPHYSILLGQSEDIVIRNFKAFSTRGWCDGIDMMSCTNVYIEDVFLRTSDDCIAVYGSRGHFNGNTSNVRVRNSILWADVAHPMMIGVHGDHEHDGDVIENIFFDNIDILEHHEPQEGYWGCMAINAGDKNTVRNVTYKDIRIEPFELGRLFDVQVFHNPKYNPYPGNRVENIRFENISDDGTCENPSIIAGDDATRIVDGVYFRNLRINGLLIENAEAGNFEMNEYQSHVTFEIEPES